METTNYLLAQIRSKYEEMTNVERIIADYFLNLSSTEELEQAQISKKLFVSKASLSRFAQKLGFSGFREFIYQYKSASHSSSQWNSLRSTDRTVFEDYSFILNKAQRETNTTTLEKALNLIHNSHRILVYGDGLSGYAAGEFMIRFKRLGFPVEAYTNDFMMQTNSAMADSSTLVIGISLSGHTKNTMKGLQHAHKNGAKTLLITSRHTSNYHFDAVLYAAAFPHMNTGMFISPQFPVLLIIDLLFNRIVAADSDTYLAHYRDTLNALNHNQTNLTVLERK